MAVLIATLNSAGTIPDKTAIQIYSLLSQMSNENWAAVAGAGSPWDSVPFRKLVGAFVLRSDGPTAVYQGLNMALRHDLPEGLEAAERVVGGGFALPHIRQFAILAIARFGDRSHITRLANLLDDQQVFYTRRMHHRDLRFECQVRDLAMATIIHLAAGDPRPFGFRHLRTSDCYVFQPHTVGFESKAERDQAVRQFQLYFGAQALPL